MTDVILLVEDNPDDEALAIRALQKSNVGGRVIVARDGVEALEMLWGTNGRQAIKPAVILMDLKLPKLSGIETLERIRASETTFDIPVVMLTTSDEETDIARAYQSGANSYVYKPVDFGEFAAVTAQLGAYWLQLNRRPDNRVARKDGRQCISKS